jgi:hypothetical protein
MLCCAMLCFTDIIGVTQVRSFFILAYFALLVKVPTQPRTHTHTYTHTHTNTRTHTHTRAFIHLHAHTHTQTHTQTHTHKHTHTHTHTHTQAFQRYQWLAKIESTLTTTLQENRKLQVPLSFSLHCCYTVVTLLLHYGYTAVTLTTTLQENRKLQVLLVSC